LMSMAGKLDEVHSALGGIASIGGAALMGFAMGGPWGAAIGAGAAILGKLAGSAVDSKQRISELGATLDQTTGEITKNTRELVAHEVAAGQQSKAFDAVGLSAKTVTEAVMGNSDALDRVKTRLGEVAEAGGRLQAEHAWSAFTDLKNDLSDA